MGSGQHSSRRTCQRRAPRNNNNGFNTARLDVVEGDAPGGPVRVITWGRWHLPVNDVLRRGVIAWETPAVQRQPGSRGLPGTS